MINPDLDFEQSHPVAFSQHELHDEEWRPVPGFEGYYEVSSLGFVRSVSREAEVKTKLGYSIMHRIIGKVIRPWVDWDGYQNVSLSKDGKQYAKRVHRLVLEAFCPNPDSESLQCNHRNFNRQDNRVTNLEWTTNEENAEYSCSHHKPLRGDTRPVVDLTTSIRYSSVRAAGAALTSNNADNSVRESIAYRRCYNGHVFIYEDWITDDFDVNEYIRQARANDTSRRKSSARPVTELRSMEVFSSVREAAASVDGTEAGMINSIKEHHPYKNKVFMYSDQVSESFDVAAYLAEIDNYEGNPWKKMPVVDLCTGDVYASMNKAATVLGLDPERVRRCTEKRIYCDDHLFCTDLNLSEDEKNKMLHAANHRTGEGIAYQVKDLTTGQIYSSLNTAMESVGGKGGLREALKKKKTYRGHVFIAVADLNDGVDPEAYYNDCIQRSIKYARGLRCRETGQEFSSVKEAAKFFNVTTDIFGYRREENNSVIVYQGLHYEKKLD